MTRSNARSKRKSQYTARPHGVAPKSARPGVQTLDPATEQEINRLFVSLLRRMSITVLVMAVVALGIVTYAHATRDVSTGVFFLSVVLGLLISFWRRVGMVFAAVRQLGIDRWNQRRYADAVYALEHFHRVGNMGFDRDGEAHYYLALAYLELGRRDKATETAEWIRRCRPRSSFASRDIAAVATTQIESKAAPDID